MTYKRFFSLLADAIEYDSAERFVGEVGYPEWAPADPDEYIAQMTNIWDIAHMTWRDLRDRAGLKQAEMCERFNIPRLTVQGWDSNRRNPPPYIKIMVADALGFITVPRTITREDG